MLIKYSDLIKKFIIAGSIALLTFEAFYYLVYNPLLNHVDDAYYYCAAGEKLVSTGKISDVTVLPEKPFITTQVGIVYVNALLIKMGLKNRIDRLETIQIINLLCYILAGLAIYRIALVFTLSKLNTLMLVTVFSCSPAIVKFILDPINDAIWFAISLWIIVLCLKKNNSIYQYLLIGILGMLVTHFRLQGVLVLFSAGIAALFLNQKKKAFWLLIISIVSAALPMVVANLLFASNEGVDKSVQISFWGFPIGERIRFLLAVALPRLMGFGTLSNNIGWFFSIFWAGLIFLLWRCINQGIHKNQFENLFLPIFIILNTLFIFITGYGSFRYHTVIIPLVIILMLREGALLAIHRLTIVTLMLLMNVIALGGRIFVTDKDFIKTKAAVENTWKLEKVSKISVLYSQYPRFSYFLLGLPALNGNSINCEENNINIAIIGNIDFINKLENQFNTKCSYRYGLVKEFKPFEAGVYGSHRSLVLHVLSSEKWAK